MSITSPADTATPPPSGARRLRTMLLCAGALTLIALVYHLGADAIAATLLRITWWQFALVCTLQGLTSVADTWGWQFTLRCDRAPFGRLLAARVAGDAANVLTAVASVGGEAVKAWVLRRDVPYEDSVPSLVVSKTAEVVAQALLLVLGIVVAWTTDAVGPGLRGAMISLLLVEVIGVSGFAGVQMVGLVGRTGRLLDRMGIRAARRAEQLDGALRDFYRTEWRRFGVAVGLYFVGWLLGVVQALVILDSLGISGSLVIATVIEALWSAVRFATFFIPASLGTLEGANAAAFGAFGLGASAGIAFTLVRRACQVVWIGLGVVVLMAMRPTQPVGATTDPDRSRHPA